MALGFSWFVCLRGAYCLCACGVGLSLFCYWSISVPPVRGGTYFSLPAAKKSRQKKAAQTANSKWEPWPARGSGSVESGPSHLQALVTKASSAPTPHYVRRGWVCQGNHGPRSRVVRAVGFASARCLISRWRVAQALEVKGSDCEWGGTE